MVWTGWMRFIERMKLNCANTSEICIQQEIHKMRYAAFFRGINVGGKNTVKMSDLRQIFFDLGFQNAKTYIQSGNAVFSSGIEQRLLGSLLEQAFEERFGFQSAVVVRSDAEIANIIESLPFGAAEIEQAESETPDVEHIYIYLSGSAIDIEKASRLCASYTGNDKFQIMNREIYLLCFQSIRDSKLAALLTKLPQPLTVRNLKTIKKISLML